MSDFGAPLAQIPTGPVVVPARVAELAGGRSVQPVWVNGLGGLTFRDAGVGSGADAQRGPRFIKWVAAGTPEISLPDEAERLAWARAHGAAVPEVLEHGSDGTGSWLVTTAIPGDSAVAPQWIAPPAAASAAARAIGAGLRVLHETLPVTDCPFRWDVPTRLAQFETRTRAGDGPADWHADYRGLSVARVRELLGNSPEVLDPVVCHGDACAPNTLLDEAGEFTAHVDLGELGVGDRWADLAVAAWSTEWNYGPGYEHLVYEGYGIDPDPERIAYYRLLWDVS
ncbi:aminoglycoside 3'-phosphotransferase [Leucobacter sp. BZR 635]